jgi:methylase of polypeptide subunit release factors
VHAIELAADAVHWARRNARRLRLDRVTISRGSLLDPLRGRFRGRAAIVIANLPFYPADDYAAIGSVPRDTIQGPGADGLGLLRQLARDAIPLLRPRGSLLLQMFAWQWEVLSAELRELGYDPGTPRLSGPFAICPAELTGTSTPPAGDG